MSLADQDPGSDAFWPLDPGSGMEKNPDPGQTSRILFLELCISFLGKQFFHADTDQGSGRGILSTRDPGYGMEKSDPSPTLLYIHRNATDSTLIL
jgi:hypothetical protein